jgi:ABC-type transport system involved in multi-copper enzyme maturation permease subunit
VITRRCILALTATAVVLFVTLAVLAALAMLLGELGDAEGSSLVRRFVVVDLVLLVIDLICVLLALAVRAIEPPPPRRPPDRQV